jgi:hypothetical protein
MVANNGSGKARLRNSSSPHGVKAWLRYVDVADKRPRRTARKLKDAEMTS